MYFTVKHHFIPLLIIALLTLGGCVAGYNASQFRYIANVTTTDTVILSRKIAFEGIDDCSGYRKHIRIPPKRMDEFNRRLSPCGHSGVIGDLIKDATQYSLIQKRITLTFSKPDYILKGRIRQFHTLYEIKQVFLCSTVLFELMDPTNRSVVWSKEVESKISQSKGLKIKNYKEAGDKEVSNLLNQLGANLVNDKSFIEMVTN